MNKNLLYSGLVALVVSVLSIGLWNQFFEKEKTIQIEHISSEAGVQTLYSLDEEGKPVVVDFNKTAEKVLSGVVHITSTQLIRAADRGNRQGQDPFRDFFNEDMRQFFGPEYRFDNPRSNPRNQVPPSRVGTGSGVIISEDGYIVTNNHVVADADDIEVRLSDNRAYKATIVGTDPSTDLALIQIKENDLPTISFSDSDDVKIGQWVLAVGNPMGLNSTVTAGIVSAKGRNINILKDRYAVEDFIQTDAAINPGNSGGALVNLAGGLIGINTAIASPTGAFAGYGFAVPASIVQKVVEDLLQYGTVQRGVLGVMIRTLDGNFAKEKDLKLTEGIFVDSLFENSAAAEAGVQEGDVIIAVNGQQVKTSAELQGMIARYRPGEKVTLGISRKGQDMTLDVVLKNRDGDMQLVRTENREILKTLGVELETLNSDKANELDIDGGVRVKKLYPGKLRKYTQIREGFIITQVDGNSVETKEELLQYLEEKKGGVMFEGVYEDIPGEYYYAFGL